MSTGKYSPTVTASYFIDQDWWEKNTDPDQLYDRDGYNEYGYNADGQDRAGHTEEDYLTIAEWVDDEYTYILYEKVSFEYADVFLLKGT